MDTITPTTAAKSCPCCGQLVKLYKRKINSAMAADLIRLFKRVNVGEYLHIDEFTKYTAHGGDFAKLQYWGLVDTEPNTDPDKKTSGKWAITSDGVEFCRGLLALPTYALVYNGTLYGFEGNHANITTALGTKFNYRDLMAGI